MVVTIMNYINLRLNSPDKTVILQYGSNFTLLEKDSKRIQSTTTRDPQLYHSDYYNTLNILDPKIHIIAAFDCIVSTKLLFFCVYITAEVAVKFEKHSSFGPVLVRNQMCTCPRLIIICSSIVTVTCPTRLK